MNAPPAERSGRAPGDSDLTPVYVRVLLIEAVVIAALYWLGRHFG